MRFHQKTGSLFLKIDQREKSTPDERQGSGNQSKEMEKKLLGKKMLAGAREGRLLLSDRDLPVTGTAISLADSISPEQIKSDETSITPPTDKEGGSKLPPKLKEMER